MTGALFLREAAQLGLQTSDPFVIILSCSEKRLAQIEGNITGITADASSAGNIIINVNIINAANTIPNVALYTANISSAHIISLAKSCQTVIPRPW